MSSRKCGGKENTRTRSDEDIFAGVRDAEWVTSPALIVLLGMWVMVPAELRAAF